ncbi:MAG TPA: hypothetical protein VNT27_15130 [Propionibacteriaceae bacterium]|nr:hypothetical protein [Propionibacteriaceae bacterium]
MRRLVVVVLSICTAFLLVSPAAAAAQEFDLDCTDFTVDAQRVLERYPSDPNELDLDGDGVACEGPLPSRRQIAFYLGAGVLFVAGVAALLVAFRRRAGGKRESNLEHRVAAMTTNLQAAAQIINKFEQEIQTRQVAVEKLTRDAERAEALAKVSKQDAEAIAQTLQVQLNQLERRSLRGNLSLTDITFVLGGIVSILVNIYVK